eukprot:m.627514 g.627514  ORF g.627514 m.627514 type:complete len:180 (-) comp22559_c0_seq8:2577-3116(-)
MPFTTGVTAKVCTLVTLGLASSPHFAQSSSSDIAEKLVKTQDDTWKKSLPSRSWTDTPLVNSPYFLQPAPTVLTDTLRTHTEQAKFLELYGAINVPAHRHPMQRIDASTKGIPLGQAVKMLASSSRAVHLSSDRVCVKRISLFRRVWIGGKRFVASTFAVAHTYGLSSVFDIEGILCVL